MALAIFSFLSLLFFSGVADDEKDILFKWACIIKEAGQSEDILTNKNDIFLTPTMTFKFIFQPAKDTYLYFYHFTRHSGITLIFPYNESFSIKKNSRNEWFDVPRGSLYWMQLDPEQQEEEKFYLIASKIQLKELEKLTLNLQNSEDDTRNAQKKLLDGIMYLMKKNVNNLSIVEKPVPIAGIIKGKDNLVYAVEDMELYTKSITISLKKQELE